MVPSSLWKSWNFAFAPSCVPLAFAVPFASATMYLPWKLRKATMVSVRAWSQQASIRPSTAGQHLPTSPIAAQRGCAEHCLKGSMAGSRGTAAWPGRGGLIASSKCAQVSGVASSTNGSSSSSLMRCSSNSNDSQAMTAMPILGREWTSRTPSFVLNSRTFFSNSSLRPSFSPRLTTLTMTRWLPSSGSAQYPASGEALA
mmetsp:Transcript_173417/g.421789  ORF Transcript_173417/g.421789 Transcript_173417/m.421789 type:complete len:200 (+) Transcript_173417:3492-4091(+)